MRFTFTLPIDWKRLLPLFIILIFRGGLLYGQNAKGTLSGQVTDGNGLPIPFVSIVMKDLNVATNTDEQGMYLLRAQEGIHQLTASLIGYHTKSSNVTIRSGKNTDFSFTLSENPVAIREVVIPGIKTKSATATKTLIEVQDVPQSIAVIGQKLIKQQAAYDLSTVVRNMTGITFTGNYSGAGSAQFFNARGFDMNDSQNYRLNGMMIWNWGNHYADNIEQVEFLKGPSSILFGDVAPGGVLNFVTKKPLADFQASVQMRSGSWGLLRPSLDLGGPLNKKRTLRFRLNGSYEKGNSFRDNVQSTRRFLAPVMAWDITKKVSVTVESSFRSSKATDDAGLVSPDGTVAGLRRLNPSLYLGEPAMKYLFNDQSHFITAIYEINNTWKLTSRAFYARTENRPFGLWFDQPGGNGDFLRRSYGFKQIAHNGTASVDLYGTFYTGPVKHQVLFGADRQATRFRYTNGGELSLFDTSNIYRPRRCGVATVEPASGPMLPYVSVIGRSGLYFQDQLMLMNGRMQVLLGARIGTTRQGNHYFQSEAIGTEYEGYQDDIIRKAVFTPRVGIVFKPISSTSLYASYAKGYEVNSPDVFAVNYLEYATPPLTNSAQVEAGAKSELFQKRLGFTVSAFRIDKRNPYGYVYLDPANPNYDQYRVYYNGHHRSQGVELDVDGRLLPGLSVTAGSAFTRTRVISDPGYPTGNQLPNAPRFSANVWLHYQPKALLEGLSISTGLFYKGRFYSGIANNPDLRVPKSYTWDVGLGYKIRQFDIQLNALNITNQVNFLNPWQFNLFDVRPLRQFVLTASYVFRKAGK